MKKIFAFIISSIAVIYAAFPAFAAQTPIENAPYLEDVEFDNATVDGGFRQDKTFFTLTLNDPTESAVLGKYKINGNANVFATYKYDESRHQTGMLITLMFGSGSIIYTFNYSNAESYQISNNANLSAINCTMGEIQPEINTEDTVYKLYIPYDLTELTITPVTADINAYCAELPLELREGQEVEIPLTVTASDSSTKKYTLKIKRVKKTVAEVKAEMENPNYVSFVDGEFFYQKPAFIITTGAVCG
ncbi:MAG: cadherin-like beta sandwich domain-containing protein, partial [Clostridiales bacterium]|nr:cadherin-like beta sandwich domain-containing protein [Clostridiales bacterium]